MRGIAAIGKLSDSDCMMRDQIIKAFLSRSGFGDCRRTHLAGDASTRTYDLIECPGKPSVLLMNAPAQPDGPPIREGKPYSQIAHLAEDMRAFAGVAMILEKHGFRVPAIHAQDLDEGLLLIENLGSQGIVSSDGQPIEKRYAAAMETLAQIHDTVWEPGVMLDDGVPYSVPHFDRGVLMIEVDLLAQWYAPHKLGRPLKSTEQEAFETLWQELAEHLETCEQSLVLRDYHSPNILWMEGAKGTDRTALIDFQDALIGPAAYDVASLAQDARVDINEALEADLVEHYLRARREVDAESFRQSFAILAAQRASKILGIFVRLSKRDGKHDYMKHLPRVERYLKRALQNSILGEYDRWLNSMFRS